MPVSAGQAFYIELSFQGDNSDDEVARENNFLLVFFIPQTNSCTEKKPCFDLQMPENR